MEILTPISLLCPPVLKVSQVDKDSLYVTDKPMRTFHFHKQLPTLSLTTVVVLKCRFLKRKVVGSNTQDGTI